MKIKIKNRRMKAALAIFGVLVVCGIAGVLAMSLSSASHSSGLGKATHTLSLVPPTLGASSAATFLDQEAGMSMYTNLAVALDLSAAGAAYRTVEEETADYIVGSVSLPGLPESDDVHCFVQKDGWVVVYYLKAEPVSKIIDWTFYSGGNLTSNKLREGLNKMCTALSKTATDIRYYHFQYASATKWMVVIDSAESSATDAFSLQIPGSFVVYERSWSNYAYGTGSFLYVDGVQINYVYPGTSYGTLSAAQLGSDVSHSVSTADNGYWGTGDKRAVSIILVYS